MEDAPLLIAAAGLRDARGPGDRLGARRSLEHGEAAVELRPPGGAALDDRLPLLVKPDGALPWPPREHSYREVAGWLAGGMRPFRRRYTTSCP